MREWQLAGNTTAARRRHSHTALLGAAPRLATCPPYLAPLPLSPSGRGARACTSSAELVRLVLD